MYSLPSRESKYAGVNKKTGNEKTQYRFGSFMWVLWKTFPTWVCFVCAWILTVHPCQAVFLVGPFKATVAGLYMWGRSFSNQICLVELGSAVNETLAAHPVPAFDADQTSITQTWRLSLTPPCCYQINFKFVSAWTAIRGNCPKRAWSDPWEFRNQTGLSRG